MRAVSGDQCHADTGSPMQFLGAGFGRRNAEPAVQLGDQWAYQRALLFQRMNVAEQDVEVYPTDPHPEALTSH